MKNVADGWQMSMVAPFQSAKNLSFPKEDNIQCGLLQSSKYCNRGIVLFISPFCFKLSVLPIKKINKKRSFSPSTEQLGGNVAFIEPGSMIHRGKHPNENTLK